MSDPSISLYVAHLVNSYLDDVLNLTRNLSNYDFFLSDDDIEKIYALGYNLFVQGKYEDALGIFKSLTARFSHKSHYWRALGAVNQQLTRYGAAIVAYERAIASNPDEIISRVYLGESKFMIGKEEEGIEMLQEVVRTANRNPENEPWIKRASLLLRLRDQSLKE